MPKPSVYIENDFKNLYDGREESSDFTVICQNGEKSLKVHTFVLCSRSKVLRTAVTGNFRESESKSIELNHYKYDSVNEFIKFLYGIDLSLIHRPTNPVFSMQWKEWEIQKEAEFQTILELLEMACVYDVQGLLTYLVDMSEFWLPVSDSLQPILVVLQVAALHNIKEMKERCLDILINKFVDKDLIKIQPILENFPSLALEVATKIVRSSSSSSAELDVGYNGAGYHFEDEMCTVSVGFNCQQPLKMTGFGFLMKSGSQITLTVDLFVDGQKSKRLLENAEVICLYENNGRHFVPLKEAVCLPITSPTPSWKREDHRYELVFQYYGDGMYPATATGYNLIVEDDGTEIWAQLPNKTVEGRSEMGQSRYDVNFKDVTKGGMLWIPLPKIHFNI